MLTPKQEKFCQIYVKTGNKSEAYRQSYNTSNMKSESVNRRGVEMFENSKIVARVRELQKKLEKRMLYTLEESVKRDKELIKKYESALQVLEDVNSIKKDVEVAERLIKHIGVNGYNSAQERLSKQHGFFEKDNGQKTNVVTNVISLGTGKKPDGTTD